MTLLHIYLQKHTLAIAVARRRRNVNPNYVKLRPEFFLFFSANIKASEKFGGFLLYTGAKRGREECISVRARGRLLRRGFGKGLESQVKRVKYYFGSFHVSNEVQVLWRSRLPGLGVG